MPDAIKHACPLHLTKDHCRICIFNSFPECRYETMQSQLENYALLLQIQQGKQRGE